MRVGIFIADSNGGYPVPASRGGAVSTLVEHLVKLNNDIPKIDLDIISFHDIEAERQSQKYSNSHFIWVKLPKIIGVIDKVIFNIIKICFKKKKAASYKSVCSLLFYIIFASRILKKERYDKVVLENNIPLAWVIRLSRYTGDYYYHFHNVPRINAKCKPIFLKCKAIMCVSNFVAEQIISDQSPIGPIPKEKVKVLYNCVDTSLFYKFRKEKKLEIRKQYGFNEDEKILLFVGRLSKEKGIDKLFEAVKLLNFNVTVLIVGSYIHNSNVKDPYQTYLHKLSQNLGNIVKFTGYIPQSEISFFYNIADIAILPSMWDEPAGLTMVEAMACGVPVITTSSGGIPEYVNQCAVVLERNDKLVNKIAENINLLLDPNVAEKYRKQGQLRVNENFSIHNYLNHFCSILKNE